MEENTNIKDNVLFDGFTINDLYKRIYLNQKEKEDLIRNLLEELKLMISETADAALIGPIVKDLADVGIKNDELLVKLATAAIRQLTASNKTKFDEDDVLPMSKEERNELMDKIKEIETDIEMQAND
jgi:hypothetical protein